MLRDGNGEHVPVQDKHSDWRTKPIILLRSSETGDRVHANLGGQYITALTERFIDFGDLQLTTSSELSDGVSVP